jgi:TRAP-type C4-dicarboxylate transport system permease large subunit
LTALLYIVVILILCSRKPDLGPKAPYVGWKERIVSLKNLWGIVVLLIIVFGGIYSGFITATEAGALGAFGAVVVGLIKKTITWSNFKEAIISTIETTGMIFLLVIGAWVFAPFLSMCNLPQTLAEFMVGWSPWVIIISILLFYFLGGLIFESTILMIITIPIFLPLLVAAQIDLIWFGVCLMLIVVLGGNSPPVGIIVYATAGMCRDVTVGTIFKGVMPFIPPVIIATVIVLLIPSIATWLPTVFN